MRVGVLRVAGRVLRVLITYEAMRILGAVLIVFLGITGLLQVYVCVAVLTAVVGLTTWVCNQ